MPFWSEGMKPSRKGARRVRLLRCKPMAFLFLLRFVTILMSPVARIFDSPPSGDAADIMLVNRTRKQIVADGVLTSVQRR